MSQSLASLTSTPAAPTAASGSAGRADKNHGFGGLLQSLLTGADSGRSFAQRRSKASPAPASVQLPAHRQRALEQVRDVVTRGGLDRRQLDKMNEDDWQQLETWALAGAGGTLPTQQSNPAGMSTEGASPEAVGEAAAELAGALEEAASGDTEERGTLEELAALLKALAHGSAQGPLTAQVEALLQALEGAAGVDPALLEGMLGAQEISAADLDALAQALDGLLQDLTQASEAGDGSLENVLAETDEAALRELWQQAAEDAGLEVDPNALEETPAVVLRSVAQRLTEPEAAGNGKALLDQLAWDAALRQRLAENGPSPAAAAVAEANAEAAAAAGKVPFGEATQPVFGEAVLTADAAVAEAAAPEEDAGPGEVVDLKSAAADEAGPADALERRKLADLAAETMMPATETDEEQTTIVATEDAGELRASEPVSARVPEIGPAEAARGGENAPVPKPVPTVSQAQAVENIARVQEAMRQAVRGGVQEISLALDPPELGRVTIHLELRQGAVTATLEAESGSARSLLLANVEQLRQSLQVQGIRLEQFQVGVGGDDQGTNDGRWQDNRRGDNRRREEAGRENRIGAIGEGPPVADAAAPPRPGIRGGLNIVA